MHGSIHLATAIAGAALLSACQSVGNPARLSTTDVRLSPSATERESAEFLETGRRELANRNFAAAVAALRNAALEPSLAAEANNALGVAYGGIGRHDLAYRYFRLAANLDPDAEKYRDNWVRALVADRRAQLAMLEAERTASVRPVPAPPPAAAAPRAIALLHGDGQRPILQAVSPAARLVRQTPGIVAIATRPADNRPIDSTKRLPLPVIEHREVAIAPDLPATSPEPVSPPTPEPRDRPAPNTPRIIEIASVTVPEGPAARLGIEASGRLLRRSGANSEPGSGPARPVPGLASVFTPMGHSAVHSGGLVPNPQQVSPSTVEQLALAGE